MIGRFTLLSLVLVAGCRTGGSGSNVKDDGLPAPDQSADANNPTATDGGESATVATCKKAAKAVGVAVGYNYGGYSCSSHASVKVVNSTTFEVSDDCTESSFDYTITMTGSGTSCKAVTIADNQDNGKSVDLKWIHDCSQSSSPDTPSGCDSPEAGSTDPCIAPALKAAEADYGNDPMHEKVKTLIPSKKYRVTVGIGNEEDGPHDYYATFPNGCSSKPKLTDVPDLAPPLQDATHKAYTAIFTPNGNTIPDSYGIDASSLPKAAKKQFDTWTSNGPDTCKTVKAYSVKVGSETTYAVVCAVAHDSIKLSVAIWDSKGADIDDCAIYGPPGTQVGVNGVTWQNITFLQKD
jgi:hypothetical protein